MPDCVGGLRANTSKGTLARVLSLLEARPPGRLLDAPAGEGAFSRLARDAGHEVVALELDPTVFRLEDVPVRCADLNDRLPIPDASFDYVVCIDGIEHLENPYHALREFARTLRPGGELFLSTPNVSALRSRARYLFTGFHNKGKTPLAEECPSPLHHIGLIAFPALRYALHREGFRLREITTNRIKAAAWATLPLLPLAALATRIAFRHEKDPRQRVLNREIERQLLSWPVSLGETLIVSAIRSAPPAPAGPTANSP
ncbi:MAG: class I SAM-dependent methyltransferase [Myxococcota bacterium]